MTALMVQGASSSAGKSVITTALARALRRRGIDVVPFKAQNMSNNARVVEGGEIGTAQYLQALAAGVVPDVRMNPVLVKPEGDTRSQVVVLGHPDHELSALPWRERATALWKVIEGALASLQREHEFVLLEGAGSPAEINLRDTDLANMRTAAAAGARVLVVADIDRGGAFAHLYGTWALLSEVDRARIDGFVLNKFRGDAALLAPAPQQLEELTGVPTIGVLPWLRHGLPDEDGAFVTATTAAGPTVAVVRYPTASNLDEYKLLEQVARVRWATTPGDLVGASLVVLPGSKHVAADLAWLRSTGLADAVIAGDAPLLGICGGFQMLGRRLEDPHGVDGSADALGLLPLVTRFARAKTTRQTLARFGELPPPWGSLSRLEVRGYEIRHGETTVEEP
ncbi:MAG: adenosylcobyric acid synthase, partial [Gaiellaceae bacterium]|nr:adenosylcobyric acid synthase [Gaiellaceae bacterium]